MRINFLIISIVLLASCGHNNKKSITHNNINDNGNNAIVFSGNYSELHLAFNPQNNVITGYYENGTGDNGAGGPQFSCVFYMEGKMVNNEAKIKTYAPLDEFPADNDDLISGNLSVVSNKKVIIKLQDDHGGCNTMGENFKDSTEEFTLEKKQRWIEIRYIIATKAFFYKSDNEASKRMAYLIKGNIVYVDKIEGAWLHCTYLGDKRHCIQDWIKAEDVNVIN